MWEQWHGRTKFIEETPQELAGMRFDLGVDLTTNPAPHH
jgi:hypothetical protein